MTLHNINHHITIDLSAIQGGTSIVPVSLSQDTRRWLKAGGHHFKVRRDVEFDTIFLKPVRRCP
jgi:hypothetical protein